MTAAVRPQAKRASSKRPPTVDELLDQIRAEKSDQFGANIRMGAALEKLKDSSLHGSFEDIVSEELGFGPRKTERLMAMARHPVMANASHWDAFGPSWRTASELVGLSDEAMLAAIAAREINPEMTRRDATVLADRYGGNDPKRRRPVTKPDLGGGISHPARYSDDTLDVLAQMLHDELLIGHRRVLDPFAGTGRIHELAGVDTVGVELEPEWAGLAAGTIVGNALALPFGNGEFDGIATSPAFANRLADDHNACDPEDRNSYTHNLGRPLHPDNAGALQWGTAYRAFHERAWAEATRVLRRGGAFVLNIKDHTRGGVRAPVSAWHATMLMDRFGLALVDCAAPPTKNLTTGANSEERWGEMVFLLRKP